MISGIRWVEELIEIAGGEPIFPELRNAGLAKQRIVDPAEVARRAPDIIVVVVRQAGEEGRDHRARRLGDSPPPCATGVTR